MSRGTWVSLTWQSTDAARRWRVTDRQKMPGDVAKSGSKSA